MIEHAAHSGSVCETAVDHTRKASEDERPESPIRQPSVKLTVSYDLTRNYSVPNWAL
jgi:Sec7-like guanine-nucleotide exchange factor